MLRFSFLLQLLLFSLHALSLQHLMLPLYPKHEYESFYLEHFSHKGTYAESRIYAQTRTELDFCVIRGEIPAFSFEESNELLMSITLKLLRLDEDEEVWNFLRKKLKQKFPT